MTVLEMDRAVVRKTVEVLIKAGFTLNVDNGGGDYELGAYSDDAEKVIAAMMQTDEESLSVKIPGRGRALVLFVYGNDGHDAICDYSTKLEEDMKPVNDFCKELEAL